MTGIRHVEDPRILLLNHLASYSCVPRVIRTNSREASWANVNNDLVAAQFGDREKIN